MDVDKFRLIEEIHKRPLLWDFRNFYESRNNKRIHELWQEIANIFDTEVSSCKLVWQKLRTAFFNEMKRIPMRVARAKRKGTYDPNKKYNTCPFFDALKFVAQGRSVRGVHDQSVPVRCDTKFVETEKVVQTQSQQVNIYENISLSSESDTTSAIVIKTDSQSKCKTFKSYTVALYTQESTLEHLGCESEVDNISYIKDISLRQEYRPSTVPKAKVSCDSASLKPIVDQPDGEKNNQNQPDSQRRINLSNNLQLEPMNTRISGFKKEPHNDSEDISLILENKPAVVRKPEQGLDNANLKQIIGSSECKTNEQTQLVVLAENISRSVDSADLDYEFLYSLVPQMKQMSHLQKLKFRAKMSSLMLNIFSSSCPAKNLDKRVLLRADSDPDKKFLISFLPFLKSMSLSQNLEFRHKTTDLALNILAANEFCCSARSGEFSSSF